MPISHPCRAQHGGSISVPGSGETDRLKPGVYGVSFLLSWSFFPCLFSASRTDSLVLAISDPLKRTIDDVARLRRNN